MFNNGRILGKKEDISYSSVEDFFEERGNSNLKHKYNYVLYLDDTPEIALQRDKQAKEKIERFLDIRKNMSVLDLGCGVGRWGELFCPKVAHYTGIDGSTKMIKRAKENLSKFNNKELIVGNLREIENEFVAIHDENRKYDIVFICGVLMYLNDSEVIAVLKQLPELINNSGQVCLIESMSQNTRLTLKDIYSEELKQNYSAIYRTEEEFLQMMRDAFGDKLMLERNVLMDFSDGMQRKREHVTLEHCVIWRLL